MSFKREERGMKERSPNQGEVGEKGRSGWKCAGIEERRGDEETGRFVSVANLDAAHVLGFLLLLFSAASLLLFLTFTAV